MPEGRLGAWRWMLRNSDARRSTYRGAGWGLLKIVDENGVYWCLSVDGWWMGALFEAKKEPVAGG